MLKKLLLTACCLAAAFSASALQYACQYTFDGKPVTLKKNGTVVSVLPFEANADADWLQSAVDREAAKGGVTLHLEKGTVLKASTNLADYVARDGSPYLIGAFDAEDVAVTGEGVIDGRGAAFKDKENRAGESQPLAVPVLMRFSRCRGVRLEDFTFRQAAAWGIHLRNSDGVTVRRVKAFNHINECNDGIDIESRNVLIIVCRQQSAQVKFGVK